MGQGTEKRHTHAQLENTTSLFDVLQNSLILRHIAPHLPIHSLLQLSAASKDFQSLIRTTPGVFRHLDLRWVKKTKVIYRLFDNGLVWLNERIYESSSYDDVHCKPLRGVLSAIRQQNILRDVQTLILDGLSVSSELCHEIINDPSYNVRVLSIREVKNLNHAKLCDTLQYACRPSRSKGLPRLKALYVFGRHEADSGDMNSSKTTGRHHQNQNQQQLSASLEQAGDDWWCKKGRFVTQSISMDWIECMVACQGIIVFDAVLCPGPRHENSPVFRQLPIMADSKPAAATHAVGGCDSCGKAPEGLVTQESCSPLSLPLLSPVPIMASSVRAATFPLQPGQSFAPRCDDCLKDRYCTCCHKWWCETCYQLPSQQQVDAIDDVLVLHVEDSVASSAQMLGLQDSVPKAKNRVSKSCWECGNNCDTCISKTQRVCKKCCAGYCIVHNEGSSSEFCDWCVLTGRGLGRQDAKSARLKLTASSIPADLIRRRMRDAVTRPLI